MTTNMKTYNASAYGGEGWSPRSQSLSEELVPWLYDFAG